MRFVEVLCEGSSDVPAIREVLQRRFGLIEEEHFRIHPHRGKGKLPSTANLLKIPDRSHDFLLTQLPIKLKNYGTMTQTGYEVSVIVVVDADDEECGDLKRRLVELYQALPTKPPRCVFRIAVEETESWFIADTQAVRRAYPGAVVSELTKHDVDAVCGAWETLARSLGHDPATCTGWEKHEWASAISPHLNLKKPKSTSLAALVSGIEKLLS